MQATEKRRILRCVEGPSVSKWLKGGFLSP